MVYSTHVAIALANIRELSGLETAIHNRHLIGVAQGILIERFGLDLPGAFDVLRRYSSSTNTKLAQVAEEVVRTGRLPDLVRSQRTNGEDRT